jgi:hypothetical protein
LRSWLNPNNQKEEKNPMRPPLWHPPIELSDQEALTGNHKFCFLDNLNIG